MAHLIHPECTSCGACLPECPTGSIFIAPQRFVIDSDTCRDCALCAAVCPVTAIRPIIVATLAPRIKKDEDEEE